MPNFFLQGMTNNLVLGTLNGQSTTSIEQDKLESVTLNIVSNGGCVIVSNALCINLLKSA